MFSVADLGHGMKLVFDVDSASHFVSKTAVWTYPYGEPCTVFMKRDYLRQPGIFKAILEFSGLQIWLSSPQSAIHETGDNNASPVTCNYSKCDTNALHCPNHRLHILSDSYTQHDARSPAVSEYPSCFLASSGSWWIDGRDFHAHAMYCMYVAAYYSKYNLSPPEVPVFGIITVVFRKYVYFFIFIKLNCITLWIPSTKPRTGRYRHK